MRIFAIACLTLVCAAGCSKSEAATTAAAAAPSAQPAATTATAATTPAPAAEVKTTGLTPGAIKQSFSALMGKQISGEAVMYHFESAKLNGQLQHNAYIADDDKKTNSMQCMLAAPTKIKPNTKVTFKGTLRTSTWIDNCEIAEKN